MDFFSSWAFFGLMALLLIGLLIVGPLLIVLVVVMLGSRRPKQDEASHQDE